MSFLEKSVLSLWVEHRLFFVQNGSFDRRFRFSACLFDPPRSGRSAPSWHSVGGCSVCGMNGRDDLLVQSAQFHTLVTREFAAHRQVTPSPGPGPNCALPHPASAWVPGPLRANGICCLNGETETQRGQEAACLIRVGAEP